MPHRAKSHSERCADTVWGRHKKAQVFKDLDRRDEVARKIRSSYQWEKLSAWFRRMHPICVDPFGDHAASGRPASATQVHHIIALRDDPSKAYDLDNLSPLCEKCHGKVEYHYRKGRRDWDCLRVTP